MIRAAALGFLHLCKELSTWFFSFFFVCGLQRVCTLEISPDWSIPLPSEAAILLGHTDLFPANQSVYVVNLPSTKLCQPSLLGLVWWHGFVGDPPCYSKLTIIDPLQFSDHQISSQMWECQQPPRLGVKALPFRRCFRCAPLTPWWTGRVVLGRVAEAWTLILQTDSHPTNSVLEFLRTDPVVVW